MNNVMTIDYREAVSGTSENDLLNFNWQDKPHRLVYDLCSEVERLQKQLLLAESVIEKLKFYSVNNRQMVNSYYKFKIENK
jgi:uncharacterized membrane protein